jgi:hypothetical protein
MLLCTQLSGGFAHAGVVTAAGTNLANGSLIFDNSNGGSVNVANLATSPIITFLTDTFIAEIDLYQKGGVVSTAQIGLRNRATNDVSLFNTSATTPFQYDVLTYVLFAAPNQIFSAGEYEIVNGAAATWASNSTSSFVGFTWLYSASPAQVPEPATLALLGIGIAGIGFAKRRKRA